MSLITRTEIKGILGLADTDNSKDDFIDKNLPLAESFLFDETHNYFEVATEQIFLESSTISFESGSPSKIIDSESQFVNTGFRGGMALRIKGSYYNDGVITVETVSDGELILEEDINLIDEDAGLEIRITLVKLPQAAKLFVAKLIELNFPNEKVRAGIESERFDDYSVKYIIKEDIPQTIMMLIDKYRKLSWE